MSLHILYYLCALVKIKIPKLPVSPGTSLNVVAYNRCRRRQQLDSSTQPHWSIYLQFLVEAILNTGYKYIAVMNILIYAFTHTVIYTVTAAEIGWHRMINISMQGLLTVCMFCNTRQIRLLFTKD